jgi:hypothetical protein
VLCNVDLHDDDMVLQWVQEAFVCCGVCDASSPAVVMCGD